MLGGGRIENGEGSSLADCAAGPQRASMADWQRLRTSSSPSSFAILLIKRMSDVLSSEKF